MIISDKKKVYIDGKEMDRVYVDGKLVFTSFDGLAGDENHGFYGEVPVSEFITGDALASAVGLTAGTAINSTQPWLKFALNGKTLYVAKKPYRHTMSWDNINAIGAVFGTKTVVINGKTYKVRLLKGGNQNPMPDWPPPGTSVHNSEWNKLMIPIHVDWSNGTLAGNQWIDPNTPDWNIRYTNNDLIVGQTPIVHTVCQEDIRRDSTISAFARGGLDIRGVGVNEKTYSGADFVWRPCLELVG